MCEALKQIGGKLHHLDIALRGTAEGGMSALPLSLPPLLISPAAVETLKMMDLSRNRNLQSLRISWINTMVQETVFVLPRFIMKLTAPTLERLTLEIDLARPVDYEKLDWTALDAFLSSAQFPRLPSVVVDCPRNDSYEYEYHSDGGFDIDDEHKFVRKALPLRWQARGCCRPSTSGELPTGEFTLGPVECRSCSNVRTSILKLIG